MIRIFILAGSLLLATPAQAIQIDGFPQFEWPGVSSKRLGSDYGQCPRLAGIFGATGESWKAQCSGQHCGKLEPRKPETLYPVELHPRTRAHENDPTVRWDGAIPEPMRGKRKVFQILQSGDGEFIVVVPYADRGAASFLAFSQARGDFKCEDGALRLSPLPLSLGSERSSYRAGERRIALVSEHDGSVVYLVYQQLTRRVLLGLVPTDSEETLEVIRYRPLR